MSINAKSLGLISAVCTLLGGAAFGGGTWYWAGTADGVLYVGTSVDGPRKRNGGVWKSSDLGKTWKHLVAPGVDKLIATHLTFDPRHPRNLWCGTGGNSVIVLRLPEEF